MAAPSPAKGRRRAESGFCALPDFFDTFRPTGSARTKNDCDHFAAVQKVNDG